MIYVLLAINTKKIVIKNKKYNKANIRINVSEIFFFEENGLWKTNIDDNIVLDLSECFFKIFLICTGLVLNGLVSTFF